MAKNNYVKSCEKRIAELRRKVNIDSAYIGSGFVLALYDLGFSTDDIETIMAKTNEIWQKVFETGVNPIKYCEEQTGIKVITDEEVETINGYLEDVKE